MRWARAGRLIAGLLLILLAVMLSLANAPAPYWACQGKSPGDRCEPYGSTPSCGHADPAGICRLSPGCRDDSATEVNECLDCVD